MQVTSFIREESIRNMQIIVISLKEEFFSKSDALLGVYSQVSCFYFMWHIFLQAPPYFLFVIFIY